MAKRKIKEKCECGDNCKCGGGCGCYGHKMVHAGSIYGLGFIGAAVYYVSTATSFWMGALGILKAIVWPAFLVYQFLKSFGM